MYVATRGLYSMKPPTIFVPPFIKETVEKLFEVHKAMDQSELKHNLVGLNVGKVLPYFITLTEYFACCQPAFHAKRAHELWFCRRRVSNKKGP